MNSNKNNIWSKIGSKIRDYQPDAFEEDNWLEMEELLEGAPTIKVWSWSKWLKGLGGVTLLGLIGLYFWIGETNNDSPNLSKQSAIAPTTQQEEINVSEMDRLASSESLTSFEEQSSIALEERKKALKKEEKANISIAENSSREAPSPTRNKHQSSEPKILETDLAQTLSAFEEKEVLEKNGGMAASNWPKQLVGEGGQVPPSEETIVSSSPGDLGLPLNTEPSQEQVLEQNQEGYNSDQESEATLATNAPAPSEQSLRSFEQVPLATLNFPDDSEPMSRISLAHPTDRNLPQGPNRLFLGKRRVGVSLGLSMMITDYETGQISMRPHFGLFVSQTLGRRWEVQLEAQLKTVGNYNLLQSYEEEIFSSLGELGSRRVTMSYDGYTAIEIPFTIKYALNNRLGILVGGRYSFFKADAAGTSLEGFTTSPSLVSRIPRRGFWGNDFGLTLGVEFYLTTHWRLDLRYNQGLRDITPDNLYQDTQNHLNSDLQISIHRMF